MLRNYLTLLCVLLCSLMSAQTIDETRLNMGNYLMRKYSVEPMDGCGIYNTLSQKFVYSIVTLNPTKYAKKTDKYRVASLKAMRQFGEFQQSSTQYSTTTITELSDGTTQVVDEIISFSMNQVTSMELIKTFDYSNIEQVFIYAQLVE